MSSLSAISTENHLPFLCRASPSNPGLCRSEECVSLILQWAGAALQRDGHQPDMWPSPAGIPLATCLWPHAQLILFLFWFSFVPRRDFSIHKGFSKESQQGKPYQCPEASKAKSEIHKRGNDLVREKKNIKYTNKSQVSQRTHGNCFNPNEQHLLMQTALLISMRSLL